MKILLFLIPVFIYSCAVKDEQTEGPTPPDATKKPEKLEAHGQTRVDNYYWLRDRESDSVIQYLEAENEYLKKVMEPTEGLQETLFDEIVGRIPKDDQSVPYKKGDYWYYTRYEGELEYPIYCRKEGSLDNQEEVILDVNKLAEDYAYYRVTGVTVSPDGNTLAFGVDTVSRRKYTIHFKNLQTGDIHIDALPNTVGYGAWTNDNATYFYTVKDPATLRAYQVRKHTLGSDADSDPIIFTEEDETYSCYVFKSFSDEYLMIKSSVTLADEFWFMAADDPNGQFKLIQPRERGLEYSVDHKGDHFYITTNKDEATNFKIMRTLVDAPGKENWEDWLVHREDTQVTGLLCFDKFLAVQERSKGYNAIRILDESKVKDEYIKFEEEAYDVGLSGGAEYDREELRFRYASLTTPSTVYSYNVKSGDRQVLKQDEVLGSYSPEDYTSERLMIEVRDGVKVPVSLVYRKDLNRDESQPLLLYGYGSYGSTIDPGFSYSRISLLDRGFIFAIAHVRGSQMMGRQWYEEGKMFKKKNTFTDFIDCGKYLINEGYTSSEHLYAMGGSAGGLLMGAVVNMSPQTFNGVVAAVPFVDVVTTMLDESIPLTTFEYDEWGNPNIQDQYEYMLSYSPYDNVKKQEYPHMLVTTGLHDSQVQYWEPAKWVAKLRDYKTGDNLLLLHTNMEAGHGGASGRFERYKETAMEYAFFLFLEEKN